MCVLVWGLARCGKRSGPGVAGPTADERNDDADEAPKALAQQNNDERGGFTAAFLVTGKVGRAACDQHPGNLVQVTRQGQGQDGRETGVEGLGVGRGRGLISMSEWNTACLVLPRDCLAREREAGKRCAYVLLSSRRERSMKEPLILEL